MSAFDEIVSSWMEFFSAAVHSSVGVCLGVQIATDGSSE